MSALLRLLLLVPLGFVLAALAAGLTVALGIGGAEAGPEARVWIAVVASGRRSPPAPSPSFPGLSRSSVAEGFGSRSIFYWFALGGGIGAAAHLLNRVDPDLQVSDPGMVVALAAGFVGGLVYWLVAGRMAGSGFARSGGGAPASAATDQIPRADRQRFR